MRTRKIGEWLTEQEVQRFGVFLELILARPQVREFVPEGAVLRLVPSGADAALGAATGDVVDRRDGFREETRVAVGDAEDEASKANSFRLGRGGRQCRDGLEAITIATPVRRLLEVVRDGEPIEAALVGEPPEPTQLVERPAQVTNVDAEPDAARLIPVVVRVGGHATGRRRHR